MKRWINPVAMATAILIFFLMSLVGYLCKTPTSLRNIRAITGAVITFSAVSIAGHIITSILTGVMAREEAERKALEQQREMEEAERQAQQEQQAQQFQQAPQPQPA